MYLLTVVANTTEMHPDHRMIGEAYVSCWIERDSEQQAIATAHEMIKADDWNVIRTEKVSIVTDADYDDDDEFNKHYQQALIDKKYPSSIFVRDFLFITSTSESRPTQRTFPPTRQEFGL